MHDRLLNNYAVLMLWYIFLYTPLNGNAQWGVQNRPICQNIFYPPFHVYPVYTDKNPCSIVHKVRFALFRFNNAKIKTKPLMKLQERY